MVCVTSVSYLFLISGEPKGYVILTKRLWQWDLISPYLFFSVLKGFWLLLPKRNRVGVLSGIRICEGALSINHLVFAYDSFLFKKASIDECVVIQ